MVFYRDTGGFLPYVTKIWLYVTPALYFVREIPPKLLVYLRWNPLYPSFAALEQIFARAWPSPVYLARGVGVGARVLLRRMPSCSWPGSVTLPSDSDRPPAVWVDDLWVSFRVTREKNQTLKGTLARMRDRSKQSMLIEALRGVSFQVPAGSVYGVIGRNGAGKSTLLRTIAGILPPTAGRVAVWGRVTPLLSLGVGFNRELTGRENILLGGLTAGLTAAEVYANFDAVEEFAGLGDAIDFPMRTYSSGMFGRLAFSVAAHLKPEILLIDEALAAGDAAFKLKSMGKIVELCEHRTAPC